MPRMVAGCAPTARKPAYASAAANASAISTSTVKGSGPARNTAKTTAASTMPVAVARETLLAELWRTALPASGFDVARRRVRSVRVGEGRGASATTSSSATASGASTNSQGRTSSVFSSPARMDASNWSSWATQSASPSRQAGAGIAAHGSSASADSRATTMGTWPVGASVQCGSSVSGSTSGTSSTRSPAISAPVIVTRESVGRAIGYSPVGSPPKDSSSDVK